VTTVVVRGTTVIDLGLAARSAVAVYTVGGRSRDVRSGDDPSALDYFDVRARAVDVIDRVKKL
jgi:hypothetical protein